MAEDVSRTETNWERGVLEKLALEALKEQRRARLWGIFFKLLTFAYITFLAIVLFDLGRGDRLASDKHTALVEVAGVIDAKGNASADNVNAALQGAFKDKKTQGVVLGGYRSTPITAANCALGRAAQANKAKESHPRSRPSSTNCGS